MLMVFWLNKGGNTDFEKSLLISPEILHWFVGIFSQPKTHGIVKFCRELCIIYK